MSHLSNQTLRRSSDVEDLSVPTPQRCWIHNLRFVGAIYSYAYIFIRVFDDPNEIFPSESLTKSMMLLLILAKSRKC